MRGHRPVGACMQQVGGDEGAQAGGACMQQVGGDEGAQAGPLGQLQGIGTGAGPWVSDAHTLTGMP